MEIPLTVVILAAGLGIRMRSRRAKVLHEAGGRTLIEHVVETALGLTSPEQVFVVIGYQADQVHELLGSRGVQFVYQSEQRGTGHAFIVGREALSRREGLLLVLYGDCPLISSGTLRKLVRRHTDSHAAATVITTVLEDPTGYGRVVAEEGRIRAIVEQKAASPEQLTIREINSGIYCFDSKLFWQYLDQIQPDNPAREYYLTDMVDILTRAGYRAQAMRIEDATEVLGINTRIELAAVDRIFRERKIRRLMLEGVTIEKPETVTIDDGVQIGIDTVVEPFSQILGNSVIGGECRIRACSIVKDSELANGVEVAPFTIVENSRVEAAARIGPYARLRGGNHIAAGARIGNFVELKNTRFGSDSKAMHLAYLGDAVIGEDVNIGAGTITCNYDGRRKHRTTVGSRAFVGSNTTLVAPVEIAAGAYLAAGSVITEPVPEDALALGRARQVNKEGWARKRREQSSNHSQ